MENPILNIRGADMSEQKVIFNLDDVNITDIMSQIHENMKQRGYDVEELKKLSNGIRIPQSIGTDVGGFDGTVAYVNMSAQVQYWWQIPAQGGLKGKIRVFVNKVMRKLTFFYMKHVIDQQNIFNMYTANAFTSMQDIIRKLEADNEELNLKLSALYNQNAALSAKVEKIDIECLEKAKEYEKKTREIESLYAQRQNEINSLYTAIGARLSRLNTKTPENVQIEASKKLSPDIIPDTYTTHSFDYFLFESKYRGTTDEIKARQAHYLEYFKGQENILDLGCGRGEFLELLNENGIKSEGIDMLPENIALCKEKNLDVKLGDGIAYLSSLPDNSLGGIFSAQVIEHISNEQLVELIRLSRKKLKDGAKLVLETLNPQCLMIYAESFYMDPSHTKPVHPYVVKFIAECEGFIKNELIYMTPSDEKMLLPVDENEKSESSFRTINSLLFGNREYALIAEK